MCVSEECTNPRERKKWVSEMVAAAAFIFVFFFLLRQGIDKMSNTVAHTHKHTHINIHSNFNIQFLKDWVLKTFLQIVSIIIITIEYTLIVISFTYIHI